MSLLHRIVGGRGVRIARIRVAGALALAAVCALPGTPAARAQNNPVVEWNAIAAEAFAPSQGTNPLGQSRTFAILHAALHDAVNAIHPRYQLYTKGLVADAGASIDAAVAAASRDVLVALIPDRQAFIESAYARALAGITDGHPPKRRGSPRARPRRPRRLPGDGTMPWIGRRSRSTYRSQCRVTTSSPRRLTSHSSPAGGGFTPFAITTSEHQPRGPHALSSSAYALDFAHLKAIGRAGSTTRTAEQTEIAKFWYEDSPLGWNRIANTVVSQARLDAWDAARVFTLVNFAMADGFTAGFAANNNFRFWRPITAIRNAAGDGNQSTEPDATGNR